MARQIDKGAVKSFIKMKEKRFAKKLHRRQKRRKAKNIENENPKHNRYTDKWCM